MPAPHGGHTYADKYGLPRPELVRSDNALYGRHFRVMELYDCIVTDPPYGIRYVSALFCCVRDRTRVFGTVSASTSRPAFELALTPPFPPWRHLPARLTLPGIFFLFFFIGREVVCVKTARP